MLFNNMFCDMHLHQNIATHHQLLQSIINHSHWPCEVEATMKMPQYLNIYIRLSVMHLTINAINCWPVVLVHDFDAALSEQVPC